MPIRPTLLAAVAALLVGCGGDRVPELGTDAQDPWVARLGDAELTQAELDDAIGGWLPGVDSATARSQVIDQWLTRELLVQQALDAGLDDDPAVQRRLDAARRATLETAYLERYFADNPAEPSDDDLEAYYAAQGARLVLSEPYLRVWLLRPPAERLDAATEALAEVAASPIGDSLFSIAAARFASDPVGAQALADQFLPLSRFRELDPTLGDRLATLAPGKVERVDASGRPFLVALAERASPGTVPPLDLLRPELSDRLAIQRRRDAAARLIQQLRTEAQSRGRLDIR